MKKVFRLRARIKKDATDLQELLDDGWDIEHEFNSRKYGVFILVLYKPDVVGKPTENDNK